MTGKVEAIPDTPQAPHPFIPDVFLRVASVPGGGKLRSCAQWTMYPNIWRKPIKAGQAQRVTNFTSEAILDFAWSADGTLAVTRGRVQQDLVLIERQ